jgi:hypothetical protein
VDGGVDSCGGLGSVVGPVGSERDGCCSLGQGHSDEVTHNDDFGEKLDDCKSVEVLHSACKAGNPLCLLPNTSDDQ